MQRGLEVMKGGNGLSKEQLDQAIQEGRDASIRLLDAHAGWVHLLASKFESQVDISVSTSKCFNISLFAH